MIRYHSGSGWIRPELNAKKRRAQLRRRAELDSHAKNQVKSQRARDRAAERDLHRQANYLPPAGEAGPAALRTYRPFRVQPHYATSNVLAGAYPFLAEAGLGAAGVFIGQDAWSGGGFCHDPWVLYERRIISNPNAILIGVIGRGKSALAKSIATRSIAFGRRVYVPGDPKGEWSIVAEAVGGTALRLGAGTGTRLNPLDEGPRPTSMTDQQWAELVRGRRRGLVGALAESALTRPLHAIEHTALDLALAAAIDGHAAPTLPHVVDALFHPRDAASADAATLQADGREVAHALRRLVSGDLAGLFDGPTTASFDAEVPMVSLDLSAIHGSDTLMAMVMTCTSAWMEAALSDPSAGKRWVIYDEAWRLLRQPVLLARMQAQFKLSRALGIANLLIMHRLSDLDAIGDAASEARALALGLLGDCSTKIIYQQETSEAPRTAETLGLSSTEREEIRSLERGEGLWRIGERAFIVRHILTDAEAALFDTSQRMRAT